MYELTDVIEFLLQSGYRNKKLYWILLQLNCCIMYDVWWLGSISGAVYVFMYFDMFYSQRSQKGSVE
jgi:hypothetical protein